MAFIVTLTAQNRFMGLKSCFSLLRQRQNVGVGVVYFIGLAPGIQNVTFKKVYYAPRD
jgi:hypothetical protein